MPFGQETDHAYSTARRAYMGLNTTQTPQTVHYTSELLQPTVIIRRQKAQSSHRKSANCLPFPLKTAILGLNFWIFAVNISMPSFNSLLQQHLQQFKPRSNQQTASEKQNRQQIKQ